MDILYTRATSKDELLQIIALQQKSLYTNLTEEERIQEGFVSVSHTIDLLQEMNNSCPHIIAKANDKVIGYALSMHPSFADHIPLLKPMFKEIDSIIPRPKDYMVMGQICIDKEFRGKGVFRNLYSTMKTALPKEYSSIITEVDAKNLRSTNAHKSVGFMPLKTYSSLGQDWNLINLKND